jgi:tetratricopeptide (TPR) repeat protein
MVEGASVEPGCPDEEVMLGFSERTLPGETRESVAAHIEGCDDCRALLAAMASAPREQSPQGRYELLSMLGAGGMGIVQAAFDRELDRKVALKFIVAGGDEDPDDARARARLLREAKALAQLAHPNVITVHDVGVLDGDVFVAMELVDGQHLREWLAVAPRTLAAKLEVLRQAGEGLAAAHAAGIVHRDFKPENVLVGRDGRARVTDFGLARPIDADEEPVRPEAPGARPPPVTRTGVRAGTPAYMAPEQKLGHTADARSDLYSYCVTVFEAVTGSRPGEGGPKARRPPRWLDRVLARGLRERPGDRWPAMRALLDAMARARPTTLRIGVGAALLVAVGLVVTLTRRPAQAVCVGAESAWGQAWDASRADAVRSTFTRSGRPSAAFAVAQVTRVLDDYRTGWIAMHRDTCEATRVRGEQSEALLDLRMRCLDDHRKQVDALSQLLTTADDGVVDRSISATMSLPPTLDCTNTQALTAAVPAPDGAQRAAVDALNDRLAEANALEYAGQYDRGLDIARPALDAARATGYAPLISRLLLVSGRLNLGASDLASAETLLHEAAATAMDAREDLVAADAWTVQIRVVGMLGGRIAEANVYGRYAESAIRRAGGDDEREATRLRYVGIVVSRRAHKLEEGRELIERARAMFARSRGTRFDFDVASCDEGIAGIDFDRGHPEVALPLFVRVAEVRERLFGENHPSVAIALVNLGETLTKLGRAQEALPILRRSLDLASRVTSKGYNAYEHHRIAAALRALGDPAGAYDEDGLSLAAYHLAGSASYWDAFPLTGLGLDLTALGRPREAVPLLERAIELRLAQPVAFEVSEARFALAQALWAAGDPAARARARTVALQARDDLNEDAERYGGTFATSRQEIEDWLRDRGRPGVIGVTAGP